MSNVGRLKKMVVLTLARARSRGSSSRRKRVNQLRTFSRETEGKRSETASTWMGGRETEKRRRTPHPVSEPTTTCKGVERHRGNTRTSDSMNFRKESLMALKVVAGLLDSFSSTKSWNKRKSSALSPAGARISPSQPTRSLAQTTKRT